MDLAISLLITGLVLGLWVGLVTAVVSAIRVPDHRWRAADRGKFPTIAFVGAHGGVGGLFSWLRIRRQLQEA